MSGKTRKASTSDSDSGPDDRNPPQNSNKRQKTSSTRGEQEHTFELSKTRQVNVKDFKGRVFINIREYYQDKESGEMRPGKKGIALTPEQWNKLKGYMNDIDAAIKESC